MEAFNMILTNAQMLESIPVLHQAKDETGLLGYAVAVNLRKLSTEVVEFSNKRDELLAEYGTDAGGGKFNLTPDAAEAFQKALQPFADLEVDVPVMQVAPEVFYGGGLTSAKMYTLAWMVKED
jgi:hypothetical protein